MRLLGIDPGLVNTGWAVLDCERGKGRLLAHGVLKPLKTQSLEERVFFLYQEIKKVVEEHKVAEASLEDVFFAPSMPTILPMAQARGALLAGLMSQGVSVTSYAPNEVKKVIGGSGHATKDQMAHMVGLFLGEDTSGLPDHITDAMSLALCHSFFRS